VAAGSPGSVEIARKEYDVEEGVQRWGNRIFDLMEAAEPPSFFSRKGFYSSLMEWAMRDEHFKTQLFRFVDVLPTLESSAEVARHLKEYLGDENLHLSAGMKLGLKAAGGFSRLFGSGVKGQVSGMARQFMLGDNEKEIAGTLKGLAERDMGFTLDVLGETVVSEAEAEEYAGRYLKLLDVLGAEIPKWKISARSNETSRGPVPALNVSVKISAFYSQIQPADPETALEKISERLRPILRRAKDLGALINFDMEHYALKELTLRLFKKLFAENEFAKGPACGLALQAYLKDCEEDLREIIGWARNQQRRVTVRLVKGAYWDYETIMADQRGWPSPVFAHKPESDANYEKLSLILLENEDAIEAAFGTHNARSIAQAIAQSERLGIDPRAFEFQMLHGMAEPIKEAVLKLGFRLREYCPVGELLPGMAYLVRRLLENTSNEGFLAQKFEKGVKRGELLRAPLRPESSKHQAPSSIETPNSKLQTSGDRGSADVKGGTAGNRGGFENEPHTDFTIAENRERMREAVRNLRDHLGQRYPLVIDNREVKTTDWLPSLNPANQQEIIGYAAQGDVTHADAALAAARAAQPGWGRTPAGDRAKRLERVAELMRRDRFALSALEVLEAGKNWAEADADVAEAIDFCNFYAQVMRRLGTPGLTQKVAGETNIHYWWPRGVGIVIAPWNFPLAILAGMATAAVVAGNAIILKPSDQTPVIGARLMALFVEAGLPAGVVNLLTGPGGKIGAHLVSHPQIDFIAFTGSKEVGLRIWEAAGKTQRGQLNLKKVVCEMGGKNAIIVDSDADLDEAVGGCIASAFGYQGQKCSALSRLIVLEENYERFLARLIAAAASLKTGPAEEPGTMIGPVISRDAQKRILEAIENGKREAVLVWQGKVPDVPEACYVPPTIFAEVPANSRLFREEIFGPVLAISKAKDFDQALALANDSEFALTAGIYSRSPEHIARAKAELICGNLYINRTCTGALVERQPFGGFKMSGGGTKAGGAEYQENFLVPRVITENCLRRGFAPSENGAEASD
jgi:RHH-type proline utilization regulon transcriptional repressor/proline dehydrogenase/delta 1-pyrroline-5-carboxylate dehydrogenase